MTYYIQRPLVGGAWCGGFVRVPGIYLLFANANAGQYFICITQLQRFLQREHRMCVANVDYEQTAALKPLVKQGHRGIGKSKLPTESKCTHKHDTLVDTLCDAY